MTSKCDNIIREPQNDRMVEAGRDCWMLFGPASCLRGITYSMLPRRVSRELKKLDITKVSKNGDCTNFWGNLWQCSVTPQWKNVQREPPVFRFVPTASILSLGTAGRSLVASLLHPPFRFLHPLKRSLHKTSLLQAKQFQLSHSPQSLKIIIPKWKIPNKLFKDA